MASPSSIVKPLSVILSLVAPSFDFQLPFNLVLGVFEVQATPNSTTAQAKCININANFFMAVKQYRTNPALFKYTKINLLVYLIIVIFSDKRGGLFY